jgi:hypothetical protein
VDPKRGPFFLDKKSEASGRGISSTELGQRGIERHVATVLEKQVRFVDVSNPCDVCWWRISADTGADIQDCGWYFSVSPVG